MPPAAAGGGGSAFLGMEGEVPPSAARRGEVRGEVAPSPGGSAAAAAAGVGEVPHSLGWGGSAPISSWGLSREGGGSMGEVAPARQHFQ